MVETDLDWARLGALPEVLQTAWGSLTLGIDLAESGSVLIRGGTSSVRWMAALLAKRCGATVLSTTRRPDRAEALRAIGVDHVLVDDGEVADAVKDIVPGDVGGAIGFIPMGVRLTAYGGGASDLPSEVLSEIATAIHRGEVEWPVEVYELDDIARAHDDMEHNRVAAKQVVLTRRRAWQESSSRRIGSGLGT